MCDTGKCKYESSSGYCGLSIMSTPPQDALCMLNEKLFSEIEIQASIKRDLVALILSTENVNMWLSASLGDPKVCPEMKEDINNWFMELFEFKRKYNLPELTFYREKI